MTERNRGPLPRFVAELKQRRVLRAAFAYGVVAWLAVQVAATTFPLLYLPTWAATLVVVLAALGFPAALVLAWVYDVVPGGADRTPSDAEEGVRPSMEDASAAAAWSSAQPTTAAAALPRPSIPPPPTALVGRTAELRELGALLAESQTRLVTISGPGGIGKTRLAMEVARLAEPRFVDGACYVVLAGREATSPLVPTVAEALRLPLGAQDDPANRLSSYLREKSLLLLIDNFEQFTPQAEVLARILADAPEVKILVTSQERLKLRGEVLFPLRGLGLPGGGEAGTGPSDATELFVRTARRADPHREFTPEDAEAIRQICEYVQGVPLAIELAAAWVGVLSCAEVWQEIRRNRDFLFGSARDLPERHRSLRAVFETSWTLLGDAEREAFRRLSVFRGGFDREAAEAVAGAPLPLLSSLLEKSILQRTPTGRLEALEVLRDFAAERLAGDPALAASVAARHAAYYARYLQEREDRLERMGDPGAASEVAAEIENIREAWARMSREGHFEELSTAVSGLHWFYHARGWAREGAAAFGAAAEHLDAVIGGDGGSPALIALRQRLRSREAVFLTQLGDYDRARELLEASRTCFHDGEAWKESTLALEQLGVIETYQGDYDAADRHYRASREIATARGSVEGEARSDVYLGLLAFTRGEYGEARRLFQGSLERFRAVGDVRRVATALKNLGGVAFSEKQFEEAGALLQESLSIDRRLGDPMAIANSLQNLGCIAFSAGDPERAERYLLEGVGISREMGFRRLQTFCLNELGTVQRALDRPEAALNHYREALVLAVEGHQLPVTLEILLGYARIFLDRGDVERAAELVLIVREHPASSEHTREHARQLGEELPGSLPVPGPAAAAELLEDAVARLLDPHVYASPERLAAVIR